MKTFFKNLICFLFIASIFLVAIPASRAAGFDEDGLVPCNGPSAGNGLPACKVCHLFQLVVNITKFLSETVALPLAGLMFLIGGIMMVSSGGVESRYKKGKEILINTLIGLILVFSAFLIVNTLITFFASGELSVGWADACP